MIHITYVLVREDQILLVLGLVLFGWYGAAVGLANFSSVGGVLTMNYSCL